MQSGSAIVYGQVSCRIELTRDGTKVVILSRAGAQVMKVVRGTKK